MNVRMPNSGGIKSQPSGYVFRTGDYATFQVIVVHRGLVRFTNDVTVHDLGPGEMMVLKVGSRFELMTPTGGYAGVFAVVSEEFEDWMRGDSGVYAAEPAVRLAAREFENEIRRPGPQHERIGRLYARLLVELAYRAEIRREHERTGDSPEYWAEFVTQAIGANLYNARPVHEILAGAPLSYRQLARHFRKVNGKSPKEHQLDAKTTEAMVLLGRGSMSVTEIAFELGFPSSQHFASTVKKRTGRPPGAFRRDHRKTT